MTVRPWWPDVTPLYVVRGPRVPCGLCMCHTQSYSVALVTTAIERAEHHEHRGYALLPRHPWGLDGGSSYRFTGVCALVRMTAAGSGSGAGAGAGAGPGPGAGAGAGTVTGTQLCVA